MALQTFRYGRLFVFVLVALIQTASEAAYRTALPAPPNFDPNPGDPFPVRSVGRPQGLGRQFGGGFGGAQPDVPIADRFDRDKNGWLDADERREARAYVESMGLDRRSARWRGTGATFTGTGPALTPADVQTFPASLPLYDAKTVRTLFLEFENQDWERELMAFKETDAEVPATLRVDGQVYRHVGVSFRGNSSFSSVPPGYKHSMNVSIDAVHEDQNVYGHRTLNLLNSHTDPTYLRSVLFFQVARAFIPAPRANYARVVINGESWGVYVNVEQFNKDFVREHFDPSGDGARWKVPGSPRGQGGLEYLGEDPGAYKRVFEIKTKDTPESWTSLIGLTRVLDQTPPEELERALAPILDVDGVLRFLAVDNALVNNDGYWTRASDYNIYRRPDGRFFVIPYDANEGFPAAGNGGRGPGGRGGDASLDPLVGLDDWSKPLRSKLLAIPAFQQRYLRYVRQIGDQWLDWGRLGPIVQGHHDLIRADMEADVRKLDSFSAFEGGVAGLEQFVRRRRARIFTLTESR